MTSFQSSLINPHKTLVERVNAKTFLTTGKYIFKYQIIKSIIS